MAAINNRLRLPCSHTAPQIIYLFTIHYSLFIIHYNEARSNKTRNNKMG